MMLGMIGEVTAELPGCRLEPSPLYAANGIKGLKRSRALTSRLLWASEEGLE